MIKRWLLILSLATNIALGGVIVRFGFPWLVENIGGRKYDPTEARDLKALRKLIYQCEPLLQALEKHRQIHSNYPKALQEVTFSYSHYYPEAVATSEMNNPIHYSAEHGTGFRLYLKLNWDASLSYDSANREWIYDPGDGAEVADIDP